MFLVMGNSAFQETPALRDAIGRVGELLPATWSIDATDGDESGLGHIASVRLMASTGTEVRFAVYFMRAGTMPVSALLSTLRETERAAGVPVLYVSDYIGPSLRDALASDGLSYADATGWVRMTSDEPLVLLTGQGAARSPRAPRGSAVTRLNGLASSRIVRALATVDLPVGVRALATFADVSAGSASKVLTTLAAEGVVDREDSGKVVAVRRRALLRRWVADYSFARSNRSVAHFIAPRGLERTLARLGSQADVAITGSAAARRLLPESSTSVVPMRLLAIYASSPEELAEQLQLIQAEPSVANVVVAQPLDPAVLDASAGSQPSLAPLPLVLADLLTLPGRSDAEAEQLMNAMQADDDSWKS